MDVFQEAEMLRNVPLFGGLSASELKLLAFTSSVRRYAPAEILMHQGEAADGAYVVLEGEVEVLGQTSAGEFVIATQGRNAIIGEMGVLTDGPRSATVRAKTDVRALRISPQVFLRLASGNPERALYVMRELSARLAHELRALASLREQLQKAQAAAHHGAAR